MLSPLSCSKPMTILDINYTWIILSINLWSLKFEIEEFVTIYICSSCSRSNHQCIWNLDHSQGKKILKARNQRRREVLDIWVLEIMSASIEALAMAGVDYLIHNLDIEEWEQEELELPPPHLLAEEEEEEKVERNSKDSFPICRCWLSCVWKKRWCSKWICDHWATPEYHPIK